MPGFYVVSAFAFSIWWLFQRLRYWSLEQDKTGAALPTYKMRFLVLPRESFFSRSR